MYPHVPINVEELSVVTSLNAWVNRNVRVLGRYKIINGVPCLESVHELGGPYLVQINLELVSKNPITDDIVQVFGEITLKDNVCVLVKFYRSVDILELDMFCKSLELQRKFVPHFVK